MSVLLIPTTPEVPFQTSRITLEGREYNLDLRWNQREERWYLSIFDEGNAALLLGRKLIANWPLLRYYRDYGTGLPQGELMAMDLTGDGSPPGLKDLGAGLRVELTYFTSDEP